MWSMNFEFCNYIDRRVYDGARMLGEETYFVVFKISFILHFLTAFRKKCIGLLNYIEVGGLCVNRPPIRAHYATHEP